MLPVSKFGGADVADIQFAGRRFGIGFDEVGNRADTHLGQSFGRFRSNRRRVFDRLFATQVEAMRPLGTLLGAR